MSQQNGGTSQAAELSEVTSILVLEFPVSLSGIFHVLRDFWFQWMMSSPRSAFQNWLLIIWAWGLTRSKVWMKIHVGVSFSKKQQVTGSIPSTCSEYLCARWVSLSKGYNKQYPGWHSLCSHLPTSVQVPSPSLPALMQACSLLLINGEFCFEQTCKLAMRGMLLHDWTTMHCSGESWVKNLFRQTKMCEFIFVLQSSVCLTAFCRYSLKRHKFEPEEEAAAETPVKEVFFFFLSLWL